MGRVLSLISEHGASLVPIFVYLAGFGARVLLERTERFLEVVTRVGTDLTLLAFAIFVGAVIAPDSHFNVDAEYQANHGLFVLVYGGLFFFSYMMSYRVFTFAREKLAAKRPASLPRIWLALPVLFIQVIGFATMAHAWSMR